MSTPDQPDTPQLTRRQLREIRNTASTPIITPETRLPVDTPPPAAPLPRAAEPAPVAEPPVADESVDLEAPALTRRQARLQEKLRTASVPVITMNVDAGAEASPDIAATPAEQDAALAAPEEAPVDAAPAADEAVESDAATKPEAELEPEAEPEAEPDHVEVPVAAHEPVTADGSTAAEKETPATAADANAAPRVLGAAFGAELLAGEPVAATELPPSFDQLLARGTSATGSLSVPNALILSQTPDAGSLVSPITATGEVLITGAFSLPENYGSTGRAPGTSDGKEIDATLVDGELPASSSPTPIAASSAISTIKSAEDIIKPPAPEKGSRLMMALAITAGVLALALAGVLIVALVTGVFQ